MIEGTVNYEANEQDLNLIDSASTSRSTSKSNLNPLYYVITALLTSICYISCSFFCWVHYNHKYNKRIIELKRNSQNALSPISESQSSVIMLNPQNRSIQMIPLERGNNNNNNNDMFINRNRFQSQSVISAATAPTTLSTEKATTMLDNNAPTTCTRTISSSSSSSSSTCSSSSSRTTTDALSSTHSTQIGDKHIIEEEEEDKQPLKETKLTIDSNDIDNHTVLSDSSVMKYGEEVRSVDGPKNTHHLQLSNLSDLKIKINNNDNKNKNYVYTLKHDEEEDEEEDDDEDDDINLCETWQQFEEIDLQKPENEERINVGHSMSISGVGFDGNNGNILQQIWQQWPSHLKPKK